MSARTPDEVHPLFARHFAAADMAGLLSLYEPDAVLLPQPAWPRATTPASASR